MDDDAPAPRTAVTPPARGNTDDFELLLREAAKVTDVPLAAPAERLPSGARLCDDRFEVVRVLGAGGMGVVYEARDHTRHATVAVKTLHTTGAAWARRLRSEFVSLQDIAHPNLVTLGELLEHDGRLLFTMELIEGESFIDHVRPGGVLDEGRLRRALPQLVEGLLALHAAGKMHRDVKPSNVLVSEGRVVVLDFGLVSDAEEGAARDHGGTVAYMAPEQSDGERCGPAVDWYAVGVVLFEALTGELPFRGLPRDIAAAKREGLSTDDANGLGDSDLAALCRDLLAPHPEARPAPTTIAMRTGAMLSASDQSAAFIGRAAELEQLRAMFERAQTGGARVHIQGGPGLGKSSLLDAFSAWLTAETDAVVLASRCYERVSVPYRAIEGIATALSHHLVDRPDAEVRRLLPEDAGLLPTVFPTLGEVPGIAALASRVQDIPDVQQQRMRLFDAVRGLVSAVARTAPLVLIIDDFQWADRDGIRLLDHIVHGDNAPAVLVVLAFREEGAALVDNGSAHASLELGPLTRADAESLVRRLAPDAPATLAATLASEAECSPLYIAELVRHHDTRTPRATAPRLEHAIAQRAATLPDRERQVLDLVALAAGPVTQDVVQRTTALDANTLWSSLASLRVKQLVRTHGPGPADTVEPYHDRVRQAIVATFAEDQLTARHGALADALESSTTTTAPVDLLVYHLEAAGQTARAADRAVAAAASASDALAFDRAADLYQRALRLLGPEHADHRALQLKLGDTRAAGGRGALAADAYLAAAQTMARSESIALRRQAAEQLLRAGYADRGIAELDGVLADVGIPGTDAARFPVASLLWQRLRLRLRGRRPGAEGADRAAVQEQLACCWSAVVGLSMVSPLASGIFQARHLRLALDAGDPRRITLGLTLEAVGAGIAGPPARKAYALIDEAATWSERAGTADAKGYVLFGHAMIRFVCGEWRAALEFADAAERQFRDACIGASWEIGSSQRVSLTCLWHMGRIRELRDRLDHAFADAENRGDRYALVQMGTVLQPNVYLMSGREADARRALAHAASHLSKGAVTMHHWQHMQATALVEMYAGRPEAAVAHMDQVLPMAKRAFLYRVKAVRVFSAFVRGTALLAVASRDGDDDALTRAEGESRTLDRELEGGPAAELVGAQVAALRGDRDEARRRFEAAIDGFAEDGSGLLLACARWRLGQLIGGDAGAQLIAQGRAFMTSEHIAEPERVLPMLAPAVPGS